MSSRLAYSRLRPLAAQCPTSIRSLVKVLAPSSSQHLGGSLYRGEEKLTAASLAKHNSQAFHQYEQRRAIHNRRRDSREEDVDKAKKDLDKIIKVVLETGTPGEIATAIIIMLVGFIAIGTLFYRVVKRMISGAPEDRASSEKDLDIQRLKLELEQARRRLDKSHETAREIGLVASGGRRSRENR